MSGGKRTGEAVKIRIVSGKAIEEGEAPDYVRGIDENLSLIMFGFVCYEIRDDGSRVRAVDPTHVKMRPPWPDLSWRHGGAPQVDERMRRAFNAYFGFVPCEALRSRDPGVA